MLTHGSHRRGNVWLWASALLFALFVLLAVFIYKAEDDDNIVDAGEQNALTESQFVHPTAAALDADWPQWRGRNRDGVAWLSTPLAGLPDKTLWEEPAGRGFGSCIVGGERFYAMQRENDQEMIICRSAVTGKQIWAHGRPTPEARDLDRVYGYGPRSTPTIVDGDIYTVGITGILECRKADSGDLLWEKNLLADYEGDIPKWGFACSPLIDGDRLIVVPGGKQGAVVALDRNTGNQLWVSSGLKGPPGYSSPVMADIDGSRQVVVVTAKDLAGLDVTSGRLLWSYSWPTKYDVNAASPLAFRTETDGKSSHYVFITSGYSHGCALVRIARDGDGFAAREVYRNRRLRSQISTPVLYGDHLFGFDDDKGLTSMDLRTGVIRWQQEGFNRGSLLLVGDRLLILGENGTLALADASAEGYHEIARCEPFGKDQPRCWTMPVIAGDRLYLRGQPADSSNTPGRWLCLDLKNASK